MNTIRVSQSRPPGPAAAGSLVLATGVAGTERAGLVELCRDALLATASAALTATGAGSAARGSVSTVGPAGSGLADSSETEGLAASGT